MKRLPFEKIMFTFFRTHEQKDITTLSPGRLDVFRFGLVICGARHDPAQNSHFFGKLLGHPVFIFMEVLVFSVKQDFDIRSNLETHGFLYGIGVNFLK